MNCLKCGAETQDREVFCPKCLESMQKHPVKPDTPVSLPQRRPEPVKKVLQRQPKPEEVIQKLRRRVLAQSIFLVALALALCVALFGLYYVTRHELPAGPAIGQNYSTTPSTSGQE